VQCGKDIVHTQFQDGSQFGATIPATAKLEKKNNDTNVAAVENVIWCPGASRVVIQDGAGEGDPRDRLIDYKAF
jgi:hypothetical protein